MCNFKHSFYFVTYSNRYLEVFKWCRDAFVVELNLEALKVQ